MTTNAPVPIPPQAMKLSEALARANSPHRFEDRVPEHPGMPIPDDYFDLCVGHKDNNGTGL